MIIRRWSATATLEGADAYQRHFVDSVLPTLGDLEGFRGAYVLRDPDPGDDDVARLTDLTFWESLDSIAAFAGDDITTAVVDPTAKTYLIDYDRTVTHHTVVVDAMR